jgi:excisionase family DNA binding protein
MANRKARDERQPAEPQTSGKNLKRMALAAEQTGLSVAYFKKLIHEGRLTRFKLGRTTLIDMNQLEQLASVDVGNHGREAAPLVSR